MAAAQIEAAMNALRAVLCSLLFMIPTLPLMAQGTYTQIDYPGAAETFIYGINNAGDMVGAYLDVNFQYHGFLLSGGTYSTIDYPSGEFTLLLGLNDLGQVVGYMGSFPTVGFKYDVTKQTFSVLAFPGATNTFPFAINNAGTIAGYFDDANGIPTGFEVQNSTYKAIKPRASQPSFVVGITAAGVLVGHISRGPRNGNFLFKHGEYSPLTIPNAQQATITSINEAGTAVVGEYEPSPGIGAGFLYVNKTFQELNIAGSGETLPYAVNDAGEVVGYFTDLLSPFFAHGFMWTPSADSRKP